MVKPILKQVLFSLSSWLLSGASGLMYGVLTIMMSQFRAPDSNIKLTLEQTSWILGVHVLMAVPGAVLAGCLTTKYGRKKMLLLYSFPYVTGGIILFNVSNFETVFFGSCISGFASGVKYISNIYIAECCSPRIRGTMLDMMNLFAVAAYTSSRLLGNSGCDCIYLALSVIIFPILGFAVGLLSPESPAWLATQGRFEECRRAYFWFRGHGEAEEIDKMVQSQEKKNKTRKKSNRSTKLNLKRMILFVFDKCFMKANSIVFCCAIFHNTCGIFFIASFIDVLNVITNDPKHVTYYAFALDSAEFIALCVSTITVTVIPRRRLLFALGVPAVVWILCFSAVSYISYLKLLPSCLSWLPFGMIWIYAFVVTLSILPTLATIQAEVYPLSHRGIGVGFNCVLYMSTCFLYIKAGIFMIKTFDVHGTFVINGIFMGLSLTYLYFMLPETFNRTLQSIEEDLYQSINLEMNSLHKEDNERMVHDEKV